MAKSRSLNHIPKIHTIRGKAAEEIYHLVYSGKDRDFKNARLREIESWLAEGSFLGNENPLELAAAWREYCQETGR